MLLLGTFLVERRPHEGASWRLGVQWLARRAWFWTRMADGTWVRSGYGPERFHAGPSPAGEGALGGVREPRRPTPSSDAASTDVRFGPKDTGRVRFFAVHWDGTPWWRRQTVNLRLRWMTRRGRVSKDFEQLLRDDDRG